jgi:hypothetical protein
MTDRGLMQQALEALEGLADYRYTERVKETMSALNERLAHCDRCGKKLGGEGDIHTCSPKPEQEPVAWQGLTDEDILDIFDYDKQYGHIPQYTRNFIAAIEAKLKEKNT